MWITRISIRNPVFATMVMVGIAVLGLFAYNRLQVEQMPEVNLPFVLVLTTYPGRQSRSRRDRRHEAARIRDQHGRGREPHPLQFPRGTKPGLRRVPDVDRHGQGDAGRARQDRAGPADLPARRQGPARHPCRPREPAAGGVDRRDVTDDGPARSHVAHRPDDRQGTRERSGRGAHRRQRPRDPGRSSFKSSLRR